MLFNSYIFILVFLPVTLLGYYMLNRITSKYPASIFLLLMSLVFYGYFTPYYLPIIVLSVVVNYSIYCLMQIDWGHKKRLLLILALVYNIGQLFLFKYYDFFIGNINAITGKNIRLLGLVLPLGISFFTFQQISFILDTYYGKVCKYNLLSYANYILFFPQLIAGPIVSHDELIPQMIDEKKRTIDWNNVAKGIYAFTLGLGKKVIIADSFGAGVNYAFNNIGSLDTIKVLLTMFAYSFEIYFDFSGYCDMATGIAKMFNMDLPQNFDSPYKAKTIQDFWKRWHITLTRFLTKYIYIPLGGSRKGTLHTSINIMVVFLISGFWHGANWTFIVWGGIYGVLLIVEKTVLKDIEPKINSIVKNILTFGIVTILWTLFRSASIGEFVSFISKMGNTNIQWDLSFYESFCCYEVSQVRKVVGANWPSIAFIIIICIVSFYFSFISSNVNEKMHNFRPTKGKCCVTLALLIWCILDLTKTTTFLYFNF